MYKSTATGTVHLTGNTSRMVNVSRQGSAFNIKGGRLLRGEYAFYWDGMQENTVQAVIHNNWAEKADHFTCSTAWMPLFFCHQLGN